MVIVRDFKPFAFRIPLAKRNTPQGVIFPHPFFRRRAGDSPSVAFLTLTSRVNNGIAIFMVITSSFDKLLIFIGFSLTIFAMLTVAGAMLLRIGEPSRKLLYKTLGYPVTPLLFILSNLWIIVFTIKNNPVVTLYGGATIAAGIGVYLCFDRINRVKEFGNKKFGKALYQDGELARKREK